ncbi:MAG: hypothetical protein Q9191_006844, partial [Dirinaria sp. TL-2023a]
MAEEDNPLLKALPPETDYLTYLTILEYNLSVEQLPTLHDILQDTTLTSNIGWDLVHLLVPLLPSSRQCLQDVARLGNPREVVLKITELLEQYGQADEDDAQEHDDEDFEGAGQDGSNLEPEDSNIHPLERSGKAAPDTNTSLQQSSTEILQFTTMIEMLQILHPRIKTKYPSRFLSTSLQAIFHSYQSVSTHSEATEAVIAFIKAVSGTNRPKLPPRISSTILPTQAETDPQSAPDPEANDGSVDSDEPALQRQLLQTSIIHLTERYVTKLSPVEGTSGVAWSSRLHEKLHPERTISGRRTYTEMFALSDLHVRDTLIGQLTALARDLKMSPEDLLQRIHHSESNDHENSAEDDPSPAPQDAFTSATGSLYLLCSTAFSATVFSAPLTLPPISIFPDFAALLPTFIGHPSPASAGTEPPSLIDAVLFLGRYILSTSTIGNPSDDEVFTSTLQILSLLSANTPLPTLRYHAHMLCAEILHSHPSDQVRLAYIKDTLENCPYENLKASAVGWLKTEFLAATNTNINPNPTTETEKSDTTNGESLFSTSAALQTLAPHLFIPASFPLPSSNNHEDQEEQQMVFFSNNHPFWMSVLNLVIFLLTSSEDRGLKRFTREIGDFTESLRGIIAQLKATTSGSSRDADIGRDITLLEGVLEM